ncbi:MAG TPA: site-2 protease family protein [Phycisphaerae bacterium]|nr:site-2 protease family protein [Phycisphaerae bacterium]
MIVLAVGVHFSPLMFAALGAWILCTTLHEFSHAVVAYWGGDDTVRGKGYLTLDPTRFIDPVFSLLIPAVVLLMGGFPLPGAAVMIDHGRLKNERWSAYVSAAGPASNLILFLLFSLPLHPLVGLVDADASFQPTWVHFLGAMAVLNFFALLFNLIPVPPLDGFGIIEHRLDHELRWKLRQPQVAMSCLAVVFILLWNVPGAWEPFFWMLEQVCGTLGLPLRVLGGGYNVVMFDREV